MRAWYRIDLQSLLEQPPSSVSAVLAAASAEQRLAPNPESMGSWIGTVRYLQSAAAELISDVPEAGAWYCFLEFEVPRRSRRIDTLLLADDIIFLIEWKV